VSAAIKSSAVRKRSRGEIIFQRNAFALFIGFQVVYCRGNSEAAVRTSSPGFQVRPKATASMPGAGTGSERDFLGFAADEFSDRGRTLLGKIEVGGIGNVMGEFFPFDGGLDGANSGFRDRALSGEVEICCAIEFVPPLPPEPGPEIRYSRHPVRHRMEKIPPSHSRYRLLRSAQQSSRLDR